MKVAWLSLVVAALVALSGCQARRPDTGAHEPAPQVEAHEPDQSVISIQDKPVSIAKQMEGQTGIVRVTITESGFSPTEVSTTVGGRVKIHLINRDQREHNLVIDRWGVVTQPLAPGAETYVEFTAGEKGQWPMVSDAPGAVEPGYQAVLKVE